MMDAADSVAATATRSLLITDDSNAWSNCSNVIRTSRYTLLTFLPVNLFEQFHIVSNLYFLFIGILMIVPQFTTTNGIPTIFVPLGFILVISGSDPNGLIKHHINDGDVVSVQLVRGWVWEQG